MVKGMFAGLLGTVTGMLMFFPRLVIFRMRLRGKQAMIMLDLIREKGRQFTLYEELTGDDQRLPVTHSSFCYLGGVPFKFTIEERMLTAGWSGTDQVVSVTLLRWQVKQIVAILQVAGAKRNEREVPIYILHPWDAERIGRLKIPDHVSGPYLEPREYGDLEEEVIDVVHGDREKTGAILYGPPGNGKSWLARYFALKFGMPIYIMALVPDLNNHSLIKMFSNLQGPAIVLMEDFDSYFDDRECLMKDAHFTFDVFLNILDGVYATAKQLVFIMTVNDIEKVSIALTSRPSRFKFVKEIHLPNFTVRKRIFENDWRKAKATEGLSLDNLLFLRDMEKAGKDFDVMLLEIRSGDYGKKPGLFAHRRKSSADDPVEVTAKAEG